MAPDVKASIQKLIHQGPLSYALLSSFFIDFARMLQSGLSAYETIKTLSETNPDPRVKMALDRICTGLNDGYSLRSSFDSARIFPKIAGISLDAAERSGHVPEICGKLGEYFEYLNENNHQIISALIYPVCVFIALTVAAVVISVNLIPQLGFLMTPEQMNGMSMKLLLAYAHLMKNYWFWAIISLGLFFAGLWYTWHLYKERAMKYILKVPVVGIVLKEVAFTHLFLNLFVYIKSGIGITEALTNIHGAQETFLTYKLIEIRCRVNDGLTLGEAFERDAFFPSYIVQSLKKGEETGRRSEYLFEIYKYYDSKSKASIKAAIKLINPFLMSVAFAFAGLIASFYVLIYRNMGTMGAGIYH